MGRDGIIERKTLKEILALLDIEDCPISPFDSGSFGSVYSIQRCTDSTEFVLKVIESEEDCMADEVYSEISMMKYLRRQYIDSGISPHILSLEYLELGEKRAALVTEFADLEASHLFWRSYGKCMKAEHLRVIFFQLAYTLAWIESVDPEWRHGDLHCKNLLFRTWERTGHTEYVFADGSKFYLPNIGCQVLISDFDMACVRGKLDNLTATTYNVSHPSWGCTDRGGPGYDLYRAIRELLRLTKDFPPNAGVAQLVSELNLVWAEVMDRPTLSVAPIIRPTQSLWLYPTCQKILLESNLFDCYRRFNPGTVVYGLPRTDWLTAEELTALTYRRQCIGSRKFNSGFMFGATRNRALFEALDSYKNCYSSYWEEPEDSPTMDSEDEIDEDEMKIEFSALLERMLFLYPVSDAKAKEARSWAVFSAARDFLGLDSASRTDRWLLALCVFFAESPRPTCESRLGLFAKEVKNLHVTYPVQIVTLQYSWLRKVMEQEKVWPLR